MQCSNGWDFGDSGCQILILLKHLFHSVHFFSQNLLIFIGHMYQLILTKLASVWFN
jgi:hypothetical protein